MIRGLLILILIVTYDIFMSCAKWSFWAGINLGLQIFTNNTTIKKKNIIVDYIRILIWISGRQFVIQVSNLSYSYDWRVSTSQYIYMFTNFPIPCVPRSSIAYNIATGDRRGVDADDPLVWYITYYSSIAVYQYSPIGCTRRSDLY